MAHLVGTLLDADYNSAHADHIHAEPETKMTGIPPTSNPGMTTGVQKIYAALEDTFGRGRYFLDSSGRYVGNDPGVNWTHMGGYNRRKIAGKTTWSQHSWWNALDIGPYVGINAQKKFVNFLLNHTVEGGYNTMLTAKEEENVQKWSSQLDALGSNGGYVKYVIPEVRKNIVTMDELEAALKAIQTGNVDSYARNLAQRNAAKLEAIKEAI